jgi:SAM-dependent methyltransferase
VIAPAALPQEYERWNQRWHAPHGRSLPFGGPLSWSLPALWFRGPFAVQPNSDTRRFEYPWVYDQIHRLLPRGATLVEIGGGLSGFQFVLSREGYSVINVDPGLAAKGRGWVVTPRKHTLLSRLFRAPVKLVPTVLENAHLPAQSVDGIVCISTLEHLTPEDIEGVAQAIRRILKPGGIAVMTVDLFLNVRPFADAPKNEWGTNVDIRSFLDSAGLRLVQGERRELFGFPEFDQRAVSANVARFVTGAKGVALAQCLVAQSAA